MGPSRRSHQHGPPLLGWVQGVPCSPTSTLLCSPPTPCLLRSWLRFPLPTAYLDAGACSVPRGPTTRALANVSCVGDGSPALRKTGDGSRRGEGLPGYWTVLFVRAMVEHPAGYRSPPRPDNTFTQGLLLPSMQSSSLGIREAEVSGPQSHGPHVRMPTHCSPHFWHQRKACYRPGRAHPWPGGFRIRWTINEVS